MQYTLTKWKQDWLPLLWDKCSLWMVAICPAQHLSLLRLVLLPGSWLCPHPITRTICFWFLTVLLLPDMSAGTALPICPGHTARLCFYQLPLNKMHWWFWCTIAFSSYVWVLWVSLRESNMLKCHKVQAISLFFSQKHFSCWKVLSDPHTHTHTRGGPGMLRYYDLNNLSCSQFSFVSKVGPALSLFSACVSSEPHLALFTSSFHLLSTGSACSPHRSFLSPISFFSFLESLPS